MEDGGQIRGDYFTDRLGGWFEAVLAAASLGIILLARMRHEVKTSDEALALLYVLEIAGAIAITRSREKLMRVAFWMFVFRVLAGVAYMSVVHGDKLARSTLGFPLVVAIYCWARVRALRLRP